MNDQTRVVLQRVGSVILVPVQGPVTRDLFRALRHALLADLERAGARGVVFDLCGVEVMDADDLGCLRDVVNAATLMGARVLLAGVQAGVAAGLVMLDADTSWAKSARTVERALSALEGA